MRRRPNLDTHRGGMTTRLIQSPGSRFAIGLAAAILGVSFILGAMPALAAQGSLPKAPPTGMLRLVAPPPGVGGVSAVQGVTAKPFVGAATRVTQAELAQSGARTYPALPPPASLAQSGTEQASSSVAGGAYSALSPTRLLHRYRPKPRLNSSTRMPVNFATMK